MPTCIEIVRRRGNVKRRLPDLASLASVYSVIVVMLYGWSLTAFIWKLPSWMNYLSAGELLVIFAYTLAYGLLDSLAIMAILVLLTALLPQHFLQDDFIVRSVVVLVSLIGSGMAFLALYVRDGQQIAAHGWIWLAVTLIVLAGLLVVVNRWKTAHHAVAWFADQTTIFLFILTPLSLISALVVLYRNLF